MHWQACFFFNFCLVKTAAERYAFSMELLKLFFCFQYNDQLKENERLWTAIENLRASAPRLNINQNHCGHEDDPQ